MPRAVDMALKHHAFLAHLIDLREAEHLEATAVGEDRLAPIHELVQTAQLFDHIRTWAQKEMIRVRQHDLRAGAADFFGCECFYGGLRADRHECGCVERAVREREFAGPRWAFG